MSNPGPKTRKRLSLIHDIFTAAKGLPIHQRALLLDQLLAANPALRPEVQALLRKHDGAGSFLDSRPAEAAASPPIPEVVRQQLFGAYRVVREVGRGGSATVYLGARADDMFDSDVAIKVLTGVDAQSAFDARFRREWQITASLNHPNIARMFDAGVTDAGLCYLVMEYVDGVHINRYIAQNLLSADETIALFVKVCSAVSSAHQHGIIHRDIKPSNILVDREGVPKLIDFGISSIVCRGERLTRTGDHLFTPDYASPEQILGQPPTAQGDVYSLGVVLFHLLTGSHPHDARGEGMAAFRAVAEQEAARPSSLRSELQGDLDAVLLKALRHEPDHRYSSVAEFQADLELYLAGSPVRARHGALTYRVSKLWRRNRVSTSLAVALVITLIAASTVIYQYATRASGREAMLREIAGELSRVGNYVGSTPGGQRWVLNSYPQAIEFLTRLASEKAGDEEAASRLLSLLLEEGELLGHPGRQSAGNTIGAITVLQQAVNVSESICRRNSSSIHCRINGYRAHCSLGSLLIEENRYSEAETHFLRALELNKQISDGDPNYWLRQAAYADALANLSRIQLHRKNLAQCLDDRNQAVEVWRRIAAARKDPNGPPSELAGMLALRGWVEREMHRSSDALASYGEAESILRTVARSHPQDLNINQMLARNLGESGRILARLDHKQSLRALRESVAIFRELHRLDPDSMTTERYMALAESWLAREEHRDGSRALAHKLARESRDLIRHVAGTDVANAKVREEAEEISEVTASLQL